MESQGLILFGLALVLLICDQTGGQECYTCQNATDPTTCNSTMECAPHQACFQRTTHGSSGTLFDMGCLDHTMCSTTNTHAAPGLVGRSVGKRQQSNCLECCSTSRCNDKLCAHKRPSDCIDDASVDCAKINTLFNICGDVDHAKSVCPEFCGLCQIVDGNWTEWSSWSRCDVTCSNGSRLRERYCTNPAPKHGGANCVGLSRQTAQCTLDPCPVNGAWSLWSPWGYCSVSCGVGLQRRDRSCSNPYPDKHGDPCFGDSRDDRVCMDQSCSDGGWSVWGGWRSCTASCGGGIRRRQRQCNNPPPSRFGLQCAGNHEQSDVCGTTICPVNGGWSSWSLLGLIRDGHWYSTRTCSNPYPAGHGQSCVGPSEKLYV